MAFSVSKMWKSLPSREPGECTASATEIGVETGVTTSVVDRTEVSVSWMVKPEHGGAAEKVDGVRVTEAVTTADTIVTDSLVSVSRLLAASVSEM